MRQPSFTTRQVGYICHVTLPTIIDWVDRGLLPAFKTIGGHRRILKNDLVTFLKKNKFPIPDELAQLDSIKILIVDDDQKVLKSISEVLKKKGNNYKVYTAADGFEAGQSVNRLKPDIVLLDLKLPGMDGFRVCQLIRKHDKKTKVIAMSGYGSEKNRKKILSTGANYFLTKPINIDKLLKTIDRSLNIKMNIFKEE